MFDPDSIVMTLNFQVPYRYLVSKIKLAINPHSSDTLIAINLSNIAFTGYLWLKSILHKPKLMH